MQSYKKKILMIAVILIIQLTLPLLTVMAENPFALKALAATTKWDISATDSEESKVEDSKMREVAYLLIAFNVLTIIVGFLLLTKPILSLIINMASIAILVIGCSINKSSILLIFVNPFLLIFTIRGIYKAIMNIVYNLDAYDDIQTLHRDIDMQYTPSIITLLMRGKLTIKDISADIMNLYAKKVVCIEKTDKSIKFSMKLSPRELEEQNLSESELYIINTIINKKQRFRFSRWREIIKAEYSFLNFRKVRNYVSNRTLFISTAIIAALIAFGLILLFGNLGEFNEGAIMFSIFVGMGCSILVGPTTITAINQVLSSVRLNERGRNEVKKLIKLKKFMKEYTLIKDKNVEDIILYEKYIPYAVTLGVNRNYEDTIFSMFTRKEIKNAIRDMNRDVF